MREMKTVGVFTAERWGADWPPENLMEFREWVTEKLDEIPGPYKDSAVIEIRSETDYDGHVATLRIAYERPKTDAELAEDERQIRLATERKEADERRAYEALKKKFEG